VEPSSAVDQPFGATCFVSDSTAFAPHGQLNRATLHGNGAGMTMYSAVSPILALKRRLVNRPRCEKKDP
jgi:hypothetical protein